MGGELKFLGLLLIQPLVIIGVLVALYDLARRLFDLDEVAAFCAAILALGVIGYLTFWIAFARYGAFQVVKPAVLAALLGYLAITAWRGGLRRHGWLAEPLVFTLLFFLVVVTLGFADGGLDQPTHTASVRFSRELASDNLIPYAFAESLRNGGGVPAPISGWRSSDRPPLQTGLYLLLSLQNSPIAYQLVSSFLQATYLLGAAILLRAAAMAVATRRVILLGCCLLPTAIINTFYTWPKMLAASYLLLVFALLFCRPAPPRREQIALGVLIGGLSALAVLSHGTSIFALIGFAIAVLVFNAWPPLRTMIAGAAAIALLYLPWAAYQTFLDPPGNRLLKWHLAGVTELDPRGFVETLRESYGALTWNAWLSGKIENIATLVGTWPASLRDLAHVVVLGDRVAAADLREADYLQLLPSLHVYTLALVAAIVLIWFIAPGERAQRAVMLRLAVVLLATQVAFVLLIFLPGQTINFVGTYATQLIATIFALGTLALINRWIALPFLLLQAMTVAALYAVTLDYAPTMRLTQITCAVATLALAGYALHPMWAQARRSERTAAAV